MSNHSVAIPTQEQLLESIGQRLVVKRNSIAKWRSRYSKEEYPVRMAANGMGTAMLVETLADCSFDYFDGAPNHTKSLDNLLVEIHRECGVLSNEIAKRVDDRMTGKSQSLGSYSSSVMYDAIMASAAAGARGDNVAIEKLEYNWLFGALTVDLIQLWFGFGKVGINRKDAFHKLSFFELQTGDPFIAPRNIREAFLQLALLILAVPGAYRPFPDLWDKSVSNVPSPPPLPSAQTRSQEPHHNQVSSTTPGSGMGAGTTRKMPEKAKKQTDSRPPDKEHLEDKTVPRTEEKIQQKSTKSDHSDTRPQATLVILSLLILCTPLALHYLTGFNKAGQTPQELAAVMTAPGPEVASTLVPPTEPAAPDVKDPSLMFEDYPAEMYAGKTSLPDTLQLTPGKGCEEECLSYMRQFIVNDVKNPLSSGYEVSYGGQYAVLSQGCGTECIFYFLLNVRTGKVIWLPENAHLLSSPYNPLGLWQEIEYRPDSRLFWVTDYDRDSNGDDFYFRSYYVIEDDTLKFVKKVPLHYYSNVVQPGEEIVPISRELKESGRKAFEEYRERYDGVIKMPFVGMGEGTPLFKARKNIPLHVLPDSRSMIVDQLNAGQEVRGYDEAITYVLDPGSVVAVSSGSGEIYGWYRNAGDGELVAETMNDRIADRSKESFNVSRGDTLPYLSYGGEGGWYVVPPGGDGAIFVDDGFVFEVVEEPRLDTWIRLGPGWTRAYHDDLEEMERLF